MVDSLDAEDLVFFAHTKFKRIWVWRNEVNSATSLHCACSAPTRQPTMLGKGEALLEDAGKFVRNLNELIWENKKYFTPPAPPIPPATTLPIYAKCPDCGVSTGGVTYKRIDNEDFGLVRPRGESPASVSMIKPLGEEVESKRKVLLKKVSQVFRRTKTFDTPRTPSELKELSNITNTPEDAPITAKTKSHTKGYGENIATKMYSDAVSVDASDDDGAISENSRKKPKTRFAESAARLRRAQRLLDRGF